MARFDIRTKVQEDALWCQGYGPRGYGCGQETRQFRRFVHVDDEGHEGAPFALYYCDACMELGGDAVARTYLTILQDEREQAEEWAVVWGDL